MIETSNRDEALPCRHTFSREEMERAKDLLRNLQESSPELLKEADLDRPDWPEIFRAAVESLRGENAAQMLEKNQFLEEILKFCEEKGTIQGYEKLASKRRQDWKVILADGTAVCVESKGAGDGNNTAIWERPSWASEFIVWSQNPRSLVNSPGFGVWSGISTRLFPKVVADRGAVVDAFIYFDGRCGTVERRCPKSHGVLAGLRQRATEFEAAPDKPEGWLPAPCVFLMPKTAPEVRDNPKPPLHTLGDSRFIRAIFDAFEVPEDERQDSVHEAHIELSNSDKGTMMDIHVHSHGHADGETRDVSTGLKASRQGS